jgi:hypothetical protein
MDQKNTTLVLIVITSLLVAGGLFWTFSQGGQITINTDKLEYEKEGVLKLAITNNSGKEVCFSSCYPYLLEKKNGEWSPYPYQECGKPDVNGTCLPAHQSKFFEINLPDVAAGLNRLSLAACLSCRDGDGFKTDQVFYSNEFSVK